MAELEKTPEWNNPKREREKERGKERQRERAVYTLYTRAGFFLLQVHVTRQL